MKYKVGDKVKLREDLTVSEKYGGLTYLYFMKEEVRDKGNVATIADTSVDYLRGVIGYDLKGYSYTYSEEMIERLVEESTDKKESNNMKYKVGDRVKIRKDLVVDEYYDEWCFTEEMERDVKSNDYILTISEAYTAYDENIPVYRYEEDTHRTNSQIHKWELTESMIEGLAEPPTDREKFEGWMRKLSSLGVDETWNAFNYCVTHKPDNYDYDAKLKVLSDYLFDTKKKMTKTEIEAELGYSIEIVEE